MRLTGLEPASAGVKTQCCGRFLRPTLPFSYRRMLCRGFHPKAVALTRTAASGEPPVPQRARCISSGTRARTSICGFRVRRPADWTIPERSCSSRGRTWILSVQSRAGLPIPLTSNVHINGGKRTHEVGTCVGFHPYSRGGIRTPDLLVMGQASFQAAPLCVVIGVASSTIPLRLGE